MKTASEWCEQIKDESRDAVLPWSRMDETIADIITDAHAAGRREAFEEAADYLYRVSSDYDSEEMAAESMAIRNLATPADEGE